MILDEDYVFGRLPNSPDSVGRPLNTFLSELAELEAWYPEIAIRWDQDIGDAMSDAVGFLVHTGSSYWANLEAHVRVHAVGESGYKICVAAFADLDGMPHWFLTDPFSVTVDYCGYYYRAYCHVRSSRASMIVSPTR